MEEVIAAGREQFAILVPVVVAIVVDDAASWIYAVRPVGLLSGIGEDAISRIGVVAESPDILTEQAEMSQGMPTELCIGLVAVKRTNGQAGFRKICVLMGDVDHPVRITSP